MRNIYIIQKRINKIKINRNKIFRNYNTKKLLYSN